MLRDSGWLTTGILQQEVLITPIHVLNNKLRIEPNQIDPVDFFPPLSGFKVEV